MKKNLKKTTALFAELLSAFQDSDRPNDQAFVAVVLALAAAWERNEAETFMRLTHSAIIGNLWIETMPSMN